MVSQDKLKIIWNQLWSRILDPAADRGQHLHLQYYPHLPSPPFPVFTLAPVAGNQGLLPQLGSHQPLTPILATNQPNLQWGVVVIYATS